MGKHIKWHLNLVVLRTTHVFRPISRIEILSGSFLAQIWLLMVMVMVTTCNNLITNHGQPRWPNMDSQPEAMEIRRSGAPVLSSAKPTFRRTMGAYVEGNSGEFLYKSLLDSWTIMNDINPYLKFKNLCSSVAGTHSTNCLDRISPVCSVWILLTWPIR